MPLCFVLPIRSLPSSEWVVYFLFSHHPKEDHHTPQRHTPDVLLRIDSFFAIANREEYTNMDSIFFFFFFFHSCEIEVSAAFVRGRKWHKNAR